MTIYAIIYLVCTTTIYGGGILGATTTEDCRWSAPSIGAIYATESACEAAGKARIPAGPYGDDIAGVSHQIKNFKCVAFPVSK